jgi:hypothetical protein
MIIGRRLALSILAAVLLLQGCATPRVAKLPPPTPLYVGPPAHPPTQTATKPPPARPPMMQQPLPPDETPPAAAPVAPVETTTMPEAPASPEAPPAAAAPAPPATPAALPTTVVGLSEDQVRARLGAPAATTDSGPAQTWTYRGDGCSLDIAFFFDVTRNGFFALSEHANAGGDNLSCLARLAAAHAS